MKDTSLNSQKPGPAAKSDLPAAMPESVPFEYRLLTKVQVANYFSVDVRTIELWMAKRRLPYRKIGGTVRFLMSDVLSHLDRNCLISAREQPRELRGRVQPEYAKSFVPDGVGQPTVATPADREPVRQSSGSPA